MNLNKKMVFVPYNTYLDLIKDKNKKEREKTEKTVEDKELDQESTNDESVGRKKGEDNFDEVLNLPEPPSEYFNFLNKLEAPGGFNKKHTEKGRSDKKWIVLK